MPSNVETLYEPTPKGDGFYIYRVINGRKIEPPQYISYEDYVKMKDQEARERDLRTFAKRSELVGGTTPGGENTIVDNSLIPPINVNSNLFKDIFGSGRISIKPNVTVLMDFAVRTNRMKNPNLTIRQQKNTTFNFDQQIQMNLNGEIGEKLKIRANYDTKAMFDFENQFKIDFGGGEDDIIKKIEAGNVNLPLNGTLISGGQNLWGIKTQMQFGPVWVTAVASQQRSKTQEIVIKGGKQQTPFSVKVADYDYNRHFFLNHYFRSRFEQSLQNLPQITSGINITRIEVWVTNRASASTSNNRNAIGFVDLGENSPNNNGVIFNDQFIIATGQFPDNNANNLYSALKGNASFRDKTTAVQSIQSSLGLQNGVDFEIVENMRKLNPNEFYLNRQLGYVSLNSRLNPNDVIFVAYEYTIAGIDSVFRVGEFSVDQPANATNTNVLFLKMLKPSSIRPRYNNKPFPTWDLMMKNIYSIGAYNISNDGFQLNIYYEATDGSGDINYLPAQDVSNRTLLQVLGVDKLRNNMETGSDNIFDYVEGVTVISDKGVIVFPSLEPFGEYLVKQFTTNRAEDSAKYAFTQLYDLTPQDAAQYFPQQNRFKFEGFYQSASTGSEIFLNAVQVVPNSVRVTAGGRLLSEGTDYTVDYNVGKVTILNPGILNSGQDIRITFETNELFGIQQKTVVGGRFDFKFSKKINLGATILYGRERPLVNKIFLGEEPSANLLWGFDFSIKEDSRFLTNMLNKLPFYSTNTKSSIMLQGEFAHFIPGFPKQINQGGDTRGTAYMDDFEGARYVIDLTSRLNWTLASVPSNLKVPVYSDPKYKGFTRAKLSWYGIDPNFFDSPQRFGYTKESYELNNHYTRQVSPREVFPNRTTAGANILTTFDLYYLPMKRGPYNYQADPAKLNPDGTFRYPEENWAGIMRRTTGQTDFEAANFEYIEFWVMDPFLYNQNNSGKLVFNLGRISEDILPDGQRAYENGLPTTEEANNNNLNLTITAWGRVPTIQTPTMAFDNDPNARQFQDVGLDGLRDPDEVNFFSQFLQDLQNAGLNPEALTELQEDPSSDNFVHFFDEIPGKANPSILDRYENFFGLEGNSPAQNQDNQQFSLANTTRPDMEDINGDATLNTMESFWEYTVNLDPNEMQVGKNYIIDSREMEVDLPNNSKIQTRWFLFRIPLREGTPIGGIQDFKSIDFIRMYLTGFRDTLVLRFGKFQLVSLSWRRYLQPLTEGGESISTEPGLPDDTYFEVATLNVEENGNKQPFNYVIPPGVQRQQIPGSPITGILQNEQAMVIRVRDLKDGDARAVFKNVNFDMRFFDKVKMFFHVEELAGAINGNVKDCGDVTVFVRIGTDFVNNYYEYEMELCPSTPGDQSAENIWNNQLELLLQDLTLAKVARDRAVEQGLAAYNKRFVYTAPDGRKIYVLGTPRLDQVKTFMIGLRNPEDDGLPVSAELWFNELRVSDFYLKPGLATTGRANIKLADLGNLSLSGFYKTPNFGGLEEKITQRSQEWTKRYDIALGIDAAKLLPEKIGIQIPMYITYGKEIIEPRFNPYNPDILTAQSLELFPPNQQQQIFNEIISYKRTYSYSFNNVRKVRKPKKGQKGTPKTHLWDIENFSFTYGYSRTDERNPQLEYGITENYKGGINYQYTFKSKRIQPFKRIGKKKNLLNEFNFYLLPKTISASITGNRIYNETKLRNIKGGLEINPVYNQNFTITRNFALNWMLTQSLNLNYKATTLSRVDEPYGKIDTQEKKDSLLNNIFSIGKDPQNGKYHLINIGRTLNYNHQIQLNYRLPFALIKPLNWVSSSITYTTNFTWQTASLQNTSFGNTITGNSTRQANAQLDFMKFYRKFKFIKEILKPIPKKNVFSKADSTRKEGDEPQMAMKRLTKGLGQFVFGIRNVNFSYTKNQGTTLPGYIPRSGLLGIYEYENDSLGTISTAPGWDFVLGQYPNLREDTLWLKQARENGWITNNPLFANPYQQNVSEQMDLRIRLEPIRYFTINITFNKQITDNYSALFSYDTLSGEFVTSNRMANGNFSMSYFSLPTAKNDEAFTYLQQEARKIVSERLRNENKNYSSRIPNPTQVDGYWNGYLGSTQDVLIPAFLAAYGPKDAENVSLSPFSVSKFPFPNWDMNFTGLSKLFDDAFKNVTIRHAYRSSYSFSYNLNLKARDYDGDGFIDTYEEITPTDTTQPLSTNLYNFNSEYVIQTVVINEQFAPLIGITMNLHNGMTITADYKKSRMVSLNVGALQLNETKNSDMSVRLSWRTKGFESPISLFGKEINLKNTITYRFETTLRNVRTQNRFLDSDIIQPTGGSFNIIIKPSVDYMINTQLTARVYMEKNINRPVLSTSFPTSYTAFGVQVRFTLN